jgi:hypothetical protein
MPAPFFLQIARPRRCMDHDGNGDSVSQHRSAILITRPAWVANRRDDPTAATTASTSFARWWKMTLWIRRVAFPKPAGRSCTTSHIDLRNFQEISEIHEFRSPLGKVN